MVEAPIQMQPLPDVVVQKEKIEITKNSRGYNWSIRIHPPDTDMFQVAPMETKIPTSDEAWLNRLEYLNTEMMKRFGSLES